MTCLSTDIQKKILPHVEKPLRYTGSELNAVRKDLGDVTVHGCCCFPDLYDIGMSHHGLQILYHIVNSRERWALSRCFAPWGDAEAVMRREGTPLFTLEYCTPVREADWIGFSVQYELQYANIVNMIDLAGLPVLAADRGDDAPVIIAGGPCMTNPEPLTPFIDAFLVGDGEEAVVRFCQVIEKFKGAGRKKILEEISGITGFYVPSHYSYQSSGKYVVPDMTDKKIVKPARIKEFDRSHIPAAPIVPLMEVIHHRLSVEVMRGCTRGCRFCGAGMYYRPVREKPIGLIKEQITEGVRGTGWRDVGLLSLSTADYSGLSELLGSVREIKREYHLKTSIPSTRIDALSPDQLDKLNAAAPLTSFTIAPEAGSVRLRKVINKDFTDEAIFDTVNLLLDRNAQTIKLYFMIGLPTETDEDIQAIIDMMRTISAVMRKRSGRLALHVSLSPFSPKPNTPFQWEGMDTIESLLEKGKLIKRSLRDCKNVKASYRDSRVTYLETVMARGDRRVGEVVLEAWKAGARFDGWDECFDFDRWAAAARVVGVDLENYVNPIETVEILPWCAVSVGVDVDFLMREREKAFAGEVTGDCRTEGCIACGSSCYFGDGGQEVCLKSNYMGGTNPPEFKPSGKKTPDVLNYPQCGDTPIIAPPNPPRGAKSTSTDNGAFGRRPMVSADGNKAVSHHYRIVYEKLETVRFLGHLDMVAVVHRAMTAGGIPLAYSQGFNPHPRVSFGPPLPFGAVGMNEAFDIETVSALPVGKDDLMNVNRYLPEGLRIKSCDKIGKSVSLTSSVTAARYSIYPPRELSTPEMKEMLNDRILNKTEIMIDREKNGKVTSKNIRLGIRDASVNIDDGKPYWNAILSLVPGVTCKPSEFISAICPDEEVGTFFIRRAGYIL